MVRLSCGESSENHPGAALIQPGSAPLPPNEEAQNLRNQGGTAIFCNRRDRTRIVPEQSKILDCSGIFSFKKLRR